MSDPSSPSHRPKRAASKKFVALMETTKTLDRQMSRERKKQRKAAIKHRETLLGRLADQIHQHIAI